MAGSDRGGHEGALKGQSHSVVALGAGVQFVKILQAVHLCCEHFSVSINLHKKCFQK